MKKNLLFIFTYILLLNCFNVFEIKAQNKNLNDEISTAVNLVSQDSIESYIRQLEDFETRFMIAPNRLEIALWLQAKFKNHGVDSVRIDTFETHTVHQNLELDTVTKQYNVVATIPGTSSSKVIICAHYDSYCYGDPFTFAPGADDDASGTAACLESARVFSELNYVPEHTIEIVAFAAEELMNSGLGGYDIHAANAQANSEVIDLVLHNDMIGYNDGTWTVFFSNYPGCEPETAMLASVCDNYTSLNKLFWPPTLGPFADRAFYNRGYKSVYIEENFDANPNYHQATDLLINMDASYCAEVTKISIGGVMQNDITTSINDLALNDYTFSVFPNPISDIATIQYTLEKNSYIELSLFDITGKKIITIDEGNRAKGQNSLEFINQNLSGIYFISLSVDNRNKYTKKIFINK